MIVGEEKQVGGESPWDITSRHFEGTLGESLKVLGVDSTAIHRVASLGYGMFMEAGALRKVFPDAE
ncbi:MAG: hypothetical protein ACHQVK_05030, partial [Candidatus Paceibacterales bacterium]